MALRRSSRHKPPPHPSTFSERENDADNTVNLNYVRRRFIDTYTIKIEQDVSENFQEQMRNDNTNLQNIKLEPQFSNTNENDLIEENHRAAGCDVRIKTEADESSSNLHHIPIDNEILQDKDELQNEITSELIIKSEHEWSDVEESRDNVHEQDVSESCDEQIRNDDTNLQEIKLEPQFCIPDENDLVDENHRAPSPDVKIKTEVEDTAADESSSNLHHVPIDNENLQDEDPLQNEITSELIIKSENELSDVEESRDNNADSEDRNHIQSSCACQICGRVFKYEASFTRHLKLHENNEINDKGIFECEVCKKQFDTAVEFSLHKKIHRNENLHKCLPRDREFKSKIIYIKRVHEAVRSFHCTYNQCSKSYKSKRDLKNHLAVHTDECAFKCDKCSSSFELKIQLQKHNKIVHSEVKPFKCEKCSKSFKLRAELLRHGSVHSDVRPFACEVCSKMFKSKQEVTVHMTVHNEEFNYKCEQCDKKFKSKHLLYYHNKQVHIGVRKFQCALCNMKFKRKQHLTTHVMSVH